MTIDTTTSAVNQLHEAITRIQAGVHDADAAEKAAERMDRMREELRNKIGTIAVAVELIRNARDQ
ncbi:hypothetical protein [Anatilimnocola floriformis]|uniref:hypothetical protein n=1 Tax=Anatilimnocola floriformis TaxID=2948575 RepID=UPI0020C26670|nr:hypothetical protein [Anatilimnocola floriformis]